MDRDLEMEMNSSKTGNLLSLVVFASAFLIPLIFALYTNHAWEDWYITYRASKNLALGNGLVYTVGERVHSFTSPLGTLIPAALNFITGNISDDLVLWLFRLFNCMLLGITAVMLLKIAQQLRLGVWSIVVLLGMFVFDTKIVDFSINGMETALIVFFLALTLYALVMPLNRPSLMMGLAWGGLMWSRPDSFVYIVALSLGFLIFNPGSPIKQNRFQRIRHYCIAGIVAALIYTPWLIWAWSYYGSFIPHTVLAKGLSSDPSSAHERFWILPHLLTFPLNGLIRSMSFDKTFLPAYAIDLGGWPVYFKIASKILAWICAFAWMLPFLRPITRALSLAVLVVHIYLNFSMPFIFPWYIPSVTLLSIVVFALLVDQSLNAARFSQEKALNEQKNRSVNSNLLPRSIVMVVLLMTLSLTFCAAYQLRIQQTLVEEGNRQQIGLWLHEHASSPHDRVFLECLGYIGFYSNLKMYDYPGLSSPEVVAARRKLHSNSYGDLIDYLRPEWLVLRPGEVESVRQKKSTLLSQVYLPVKTFDVSKQIASYSFLPGRSYLKFDQTFVVFGRHDMANL